MINTRNLPKLNIGGSKKMKKVLKMIKKMKNYKNKKTKKFKGGDFLLGNNPNSPITSFGTSSGAYDHYNLINANSSVNPAVYEQPIMKAYGDHNSPMI
jgi:hypothetical protein